MSNAKKVWFEVWIDGEPLRSAEGDVLEFHESPRSGHPMSTLNLDFIARHADPEKVKVREFSE